MNSTDMQTLANLVRQYADDIDGELEEAEEDGEVGKLEDIQTALSDIAAHLRDKGY